ncbi:MAG: serine/threonine protein kinase [Kofleriaceae bacterium]
MGTAPKPPAPPKAPPLDPPPPDIKVGDVVLDRYRVVEQVAQGGHSVVFRGQDERLNRPVCIKVFSGLGGKSGVGRTSYEHFVQEAFALSRLTHPNTLRIYDFGHLGSKDQEGMPLQVCEFMNGGTLSMIVREQGKQSVAETVRVIGAMCSALAEAHQLGIVHRDIKPQNILFGSVGEKKLPKLADFGIAKWSADDEKEQSKRAEDTAIVAGQKLAMYSPSWAAPEQLAGQPVSAATDIYSLAVVAIYMLSGKAIFADEDVYAGYKKRRQADELVSDALKPLGVSKKVQDILTKALAFDPKKRTAKVDELRAQLDHAIEVESDEVTGLPQAGVGQEPTQSLLAGIHDVDTPPSGQRALPPRPPPPRSSPPATKASTNAPSYETTAQISAAIDAGALASPPSRPSLGPSHTEPPLPPSPLAPPATTTTPASWQPEAVARPPWMAIHTPVTGPGRSIALSDLPQYAGERSVHFVMVGPNNQVDLLGPQNTKVRITLIIAPSGLMIHVKGLTCFVAKLGGRPSPAVHLDQPGDISLVTPRAQEIGHIRVSTGTPEPNQRSFTIGVERVSVRTEDCIDPILFDFGPGSDAYFIYTRGRMIPKTRPR